MRADQVTNPTSETVEAFVTEIARQRAQPPQTRSFASIRDVAQRLGLHRVAPQQVVVGGTNGKGSTVRFLQQILSRQGLRVGTTTSPHLHSYFERIMLDGVRVEANQCLNAIRSIADATGDVSLTYFDLTTLAALHLFNDWEVDVALVEVGLGGRLDCANIVDSDVAVITNVDIDHSDVLGNTIELISREKVPIARAKKPLVFADERENRVVDEYAMQLESTLFRLGRDFGISDTRSAFVTDALETRAFVIPPSIDYALESFASALQAAILLDHAPSDEQLATTRFSTLEGRLERRFIHDRYWIFDVAHNPYAIRYLRQALARQNFTECVVVFACYSDKDVRGMLESLMKRIPGNAVEVVAIVITDAQGTRALSAAEIRKEVRERDCPIHVKSRISDALAVASKLSRNKDTPVVTLGSFDIVSRVREALNISVSENSAL